MNQHKGILYFFLLIIVSTSFKVLYTRGESWLSRDHILNNTILRLMEKPQTSLITLVNHEKNIVNGSIVEYRDGYCMVFRSYTKQSLCKECPLKKSDINVVMLDKQFKQTSQVHTITPTASFCPEDPRLFIFNSELYVLFNDEPFTHAHHEKKHGWLSRRMFMGKLNLYKKEIENIHQIQAPISMLRKREKNWVPFESNEKLHFIYGTNPYTTFNTHQLFIPAEIDQQLYRIWQKDPWGEILGGTPARLIDDIFISFFHAWHRSTGNKHVYYVMGAYVFESKPPFKILAVTPEPIFIPETYSAPHLEKRKHVIYPTGIAFEQKKDGKTIIHVSCGENDASTRIISFDKDKLLNNMQKL